MSQAITLIELNEEIRNVLKNNLQISYWVTGEISELKENASGHCYLELIQKEEDSERIIARNRAIIWSNNYRMIKAYFETTTRQLFIPGIHIMVKVNIEYHEIYGLSLTIFDIEPVYTVGELEIKKQKILEKLTEEGVINMNKELDFPVLPKTIAIISSKSAAGYKDFIDQLMNNPRGFRFSIRLFPAFMQGNEAEASVIAALDKIYSYEHIFDCVIIIRGGGSQTDLNCFNSYQIASHIAQFPLPVITGIGHEQDDTITDIVAHTRLKTPTAVAEYLINIYTEKWNQLEVFREIITLELSKKMHAYKQNLATKASRVIQKANEKFYNTKSVLHSMNEKLKYTLYQFCERQEKRLAMLTNSVEKKSDRHLLKHTYLLKRTGETLKIKTNNVLLNNKYRLNIKSDAIRNLDPLVILDRGYSITMNNGKVVKSSKQINIDDPIETRLSKGKIKSKITDKT